MSKNIWHCALEIPLFDDTVVFIDDLNNWHTGYTQRDNDGITDHDSGEIYTEENVLRWAYIKDLLALETENKDLSYKIGKLETELEKTRKELEQSEICCTEWEKQALDYKAENIALSGDLECTRKALDVAVDALKSAHKYYQNCVIREKQPQEINWYCTAMNMDIDIFKALEQITALEQKDK